MIKVKSIKRIRHTGKVYDLKIEDNPSYTVEDCVVHNSAAGSLVLYCLDVTSVDPIKYNLLFERFLDASRLDEIINKGGKIKGEDLPDVDIDWSDRNAIIGYLVSKYGKTNTCSIGTVGRFKNKSLLLDLGRMNNVDISEIYRVTQGQLAEAGVEAEKLDVDKLRALSNDLDKLFVAYPMMERPFDRLRGQISFNGVHAAGVLVSDVDLTDLLPVRRSGEGIVSCWQEGIDDRELGRMGFIKMDVLAVTAMDLIENVIKLVKKNRGISLNRDTLPLSELHALKLANDFDFLYVWQLDTPLSSKVVKAMNGIHCFEDISVVNALMRPSALMNNFHVKFGNRRSGQEKFYIPDCLKPYMSEAYGLPIYQESAYHIGIHLAGFSTVDSYKFMKLLYKGKMTEKVIPYWKDKFNKGCESKIGTGECRIDYPEQIFNELLKFQGYGFCLSYDTEVINSKGDDISVQNIIDELSAGQQVLLQSYDVDTKTVIIDECISVNHEGKADVYEVKFDDGSVELCTLAHEFVCSDGHEYPLWKIVERNLEIVDKKGLQSTANYGMIYVERG